MKDDVKRYLKKELKSYEETVTLTKKERKALHKWVKEGHSVHEACVSNYVPDLGYLGQDFLDVYREDAYIKQNLKGKTEHEKERWIREYLGYDKPQPQYEPSRDMLKLHVRDLEKQLFNLWAFVNEEGLCRDAEEYMEAHSDNDVPFLSYI